MKIRRALQFLVAILPIGRKLIYRHCFGARIGERVHIGFGSVLLFDSLELGAAVHIASFTYLNADSISIGTRSSIGRFTQVSVNSFELGPSCTISPQVNIRGDRDDTRSRFSAGAECWIFEYCYINVARPVSMGRNVGVGGGTYIFTHGFWLSQLHGYPTSFGEVRIGNDVWLPWGCFILPGVEIGEGCVVGARSLVNKSIPPFALAAGSPAKVIRDRVNVEVTTGQRVDLLIAATEEFCSLRRISLQVETVEGWRILRIAGIKQVAIADRVPADLSAQEVQGLLRVVHEPLTSVGPCSGALYSTASFQCTPRSTFNTMQANWLGHLRSIGTRHYPLDEVRVE